MKNDTIHKLLAKLNAQPVLMDVGASDAPPEIWNGIAPHSIYIGFDPDSRELHEVSDGRFRKSIMVNEAVTADAGSKQVTFYFTHSPFCSSTLHPDLASLRNYLFSNLFEVERESNVPASTLESIMKKISLPGVDWLKVDSQGTDLRIINSLGRELRSRLLAIDIEPGLIDAYQGEDLFIDAHRELTRAGFWLSECNVKGAIRMRRSTLEKLMTGDGNVTEKGVRHSFRKSPGWCEARYLRSLESMATEEYTPREYVLLWIFALIDNQLGFALDLEAEYEKRFGRDELLATMKTESGAQLRHRLNAIRWQSAKSLPRRILRKLRVLS